VVPLEVRQIGIRMAVADGDGEKKEGARAPTGDSCGGLGAAQRREIVEACVRAVLAELKMGRER
jgi:hypothetical protein